MSAPLEDLPGIGPQTAESLRAAGFDTHQSIAVSSPNELARIASVDEFTAANIIQEAREAANIGGFEMGSNVLQRRESIEQLSTGVSTLDKLLRGGIETQGLTEIYGSEGSGRSFFAHQLCIMAQLPAEHGGLNGGSLYIDTRDKFDPERIANIIRGLSTEKRIALLNKYDIAGEPESQATLDTCLRSVLDNIHVSSPKNSNEQLLTAEQAKVEVEQHAETASPIQLVCVDSLTAHFRVEYPTRGDLAERAQKMNKHLHDLKRIADLHNCAIFFTNDSGDKSHKSFGGNIVSHSSTFRLKFLITSETKRTVRIVDAPNLVPGETKLRITNTGLHPV